MPTEVKGGKLEVQTGSLAYLVSVIVSRVAHCNNNHAYDQYSH